MEMAPLRILVIEDEPMIAMLFEELLTEMGHEVVGIAGTETDAVAAALKFKPGFMFVDAHLGKGSGIAAVAKILLAGFIPHVFTSGDMSSVRAERPDAIVIAKPFREPDLRRAIELALNS